jgi:hypothetical protein
MKATRTTIKYGSVDLEVFMLPDGTYKLSQTQAGLSINKRPASLNEFLAGKSSEALPYKDSNLIEVEIDSRPGIKFNAVPIKLIVAYWTYWANKGNTLAQALLAAGTEETINRLCDTAFNVVKSDEEYHNQTLDNVNQNQMLFEMMKMINSMNEKLTQQEETNKQLLSRTTKLDAIEEAHTNNPGIKDVIDAELEHNYSDDVSFTVVEYLNHKGVSLDHAATLSKRAPQFVRCGSFGQPSRNSKSQFVYTGNQVNYLDCALRTILDI